MTPVIAARSLGVTLGRIPVLREVTFEIAAGETVAVLGGNGAGKTTLFRAILGIQPITTGELLLYGQPVASFRDWGRIAYVPQRSSLQLRQATVREVVESGRLAHRKPFAPLSRRDRRLITDALERVGLESRQKDAFDHLSGGQQQRTLIARALVGEPDVMLLDEPLAGVDLATQDVLAATLLDLHHSGMTLLLVLHEIGAFTGHLDRAIVLRNGRLISDGPLPDDPHSHGHEVASPPSAPALVRGALEAD